MHLDTHVLLWVLAEEWSRLPVPVRQLLDTETLVVSPIVSLELTYLHEIGRITATSDQVLTAAAPLGLVRSRASLQVVVDAAAALSWTRDPFDRLIVGNALADNAPLLTADRTIREHLPSARWPT